MPPLYLMQTSQLLFELDVGNNMDMFLNWFCIFLKIKSLCLNALTVSEDLPAQHLLITQNTLMMFDSYFTGLVQELEI